MRAKMILKSLMHQCNMSIVSLVHLSTRTGLLTYDLAKKRSAGSRSSRAQVLPPLDSSNDGLTDLEDASPTPKNTGRGLKRTYAIIDVPTSQASTGRDDEYEPDTEPEKSSAHEDDEDEDDPTPKKKQKVMKVPIRAAIKASREELDTRKDQSKVSTPLDQ